MYFVSCILYGRQNQILGIRNTKYRIHNTIMKVLFLNYEYPPLGGGAGNATQYLLREYAKYSELEVHLVTSSIDDEAHDECLGGRVFIHSVPIGKNSQNLHFQSQKDLLLYAWRGYVRAEELIKEGGYDVIHAFFTVPCGYMAMRLGQKYHLPYLVSLRGADVPGFSERFTFLYSFLKPLIRRVWRQAARVIAVSLGMQRLAQKTAPTQVISVIPNGIAVEEFSRASGSQDAKLRVISTSRLTPRKGLRFVIQALARLREEQGITDIEVLLIGDGHEREALTSLARETGVIEQVRFLGRVEHEQLKKWYAQADVFILPSMNEGMSNAMLEALASGLPLLVTRTGGADEVLEEGVNGFALEMRSAEDIAEKLLCLRNDHALRERMALASRHKAESMSWSQAAEQYIRVYREINSR